jgi:hypothetical protein
MAMAMAMAPPAMAAYEGLSLVSRAVYAVPATLPDQAISTQCQCGKISQNMSQNMNQNMN